MVQMMPGSQASAIETSDADTPAVVPRSLSRTEKAAVIVRLLLNEGADIPLEELPDSLQEQLTHQLGRMGLVDRVTLGAVAQEFAGRAGQCRIVLPAWVGRCFRRGERQDRPRHRGAIAQSCGS